MGFANHINNAPFDAWTKGTEINLIDLKNAINLVTFRTCLPIHQRIDERYIFIAFFLTETNNIFPLSHTLTLVSLTSRTNPFLVGTAGMRIVHSKCHLVHLQNMRRKE